MPLITRPLLRLQQRHRAVELREHAAPVDVPDQQHRRIHQLCQAHVDDVVLLQVDLRRAARALDDDDVVFRRQALIGLQDLRNQALFSCGNIPPRAYCPRTSPFTITWLPVSLLGLSRIGFMRTSGSTARGLRLHHLRAAHLQPVAGDIAVQRHVLALERRHPLAVLPENAAQRRDQQAFARARTSCPAP